MGLITAETIAANGGVIPGTDVTVAAENVPGKPSGTPPQQPAQIKPAGSPNANAPQVPPTIPEEKQQQQPVVDGPPPPYFEQPTSGPSPPNPQTLSPLPTPANGFVQSTPLSGYNEFAQMSKEPSEQSSPRFMLDWTQMQMPMGFDPMARPDLMMGPDLGFDPNVMPLGPSGDPMLTIMPDIANAGVGPMITPIETPKVERAFSDLEIGSSAAMFYPHGRHTSTTSVTASGVSDLGAIIAAQDGWTKMNLERLEHTLRNHESWSNWTPNWDESDFAGAESLTVMQLHESTRDKLLAITQTFLHKALEIHREGMYFLRSYANGFERYYSLTSRGILDANELMHCYNDRASSLLILMMIAQGAMNIPSVEARWLTGGLTEACRISLFDLIERNIVMSGDPIVLHAALLFTVQAAWSGDKWQMDIAMGQRGMYSYMLRHSGVLDKPVAPTTMDQRANTDHLWTDWIQHESRSRLVYSWVMVDQDLALFHDTAPLFSVTEFGAPMPDADRLWMAKSAAEWSSVFEHVHEFGNGMSSVGSGVRPLSLRDLFRHFLDDEMVSHGIEMTALQLRLLLHPLQSMVHHYSQLISCFSDSIQSRNKTGRAVTAASTKVRLEEVQSLLQRWYELAERYCKSNPMCAMMQANLVMFHLISLNAVTNFPEIERLARREGFDGTYAQLVWIHKRCISDIEEAVFHCGQVFRIIRSMPRGVRPPWWAGAIYRVALILWTDSLTHKESLTPNSNGMFPGPSFAVDSSQPTTHRSCDTSPSAMVCLAFLSATALRFRWTTLSRFCRTASKSSTRERRRGFPTASEASSKDLPEDKHILSYLLLLLFEAVSAKAAATFRVS
ncbi:hypothetical protein H2203_005514 [Taxawa tesnikishii (nom. ined.)]|nr:hypothetical protein H2203_005514 [Dothideales sp. JES 119]